MFFENSIEIVFILQYYSISKCKETNIMAWKDDIEENLKFGVVEILILKLLSKEDMYGYQIKQDILARSNGHINIKEGSLYGPLYKMLGKGFISTHREMAGEKRFRNYYHLEQIGKEYLNIAEELFDNIIGGAQKIMKDE